MTDGGKKCWCRSFVVNRNERRHVSTVTRGRYSVFSMLGSSSVETVSVAFTKRALTYMLIQDEFATIISKVASFAPTSLF